MNEKNKNTLLWAFLGLVFLLAIAASFGLGYHTRDLSARAENRNIRATIQQMENGINSLGTQLGAAQAELERGQRAYSQAGEVTADIKRSNEQSQYLIDDSQQRVSELKKQFADIDRANNLDREDE